MNVAELIAILKVLPQDALIVAPGRDHDYRVASCQTTKAVAVNFYRNAQGRISFQHLSECHWSQKELKKVFDEPSEIIPVVVIS